ncbi:DUF2946 family protein [Pseudothauera rhizosphaerae]|uniref:DUF2946 family protein n=1 Tax=Pseudothauera rhizosphaerae TaxID=2565932 RepID=A0A4S4ASB8_9RHOO|nr:DUF2946 family protein [Pseudothauera rhizosphaerae]THF62715.1 DUF2946 family protein [Pseudothauera rhizosphaerae]
MDGELAHPLQPWPDVPACYGWLSLDRRGHWRLKGERVTHAGLAAFLNTRYRADEAGNWLVDNGPQRVFVALDYLPWVVRLAPDGSLATHTGRSARLRGAPLMDEDGCIVLDTDAGPALLHDLDLPDFLAALQDSDGSPVGEETLLALMQGDASQAALWRGHRLQPVRSAELPARFGFRPDPAP